MELPIIGIICVAIAYIITVLLSFFKKGVDVEKRVDEIKHMSADKLVDLANDIIKRSTNKHK